MNLVLVPDHILPSEPSRSIPGSEQGTGFNPLRHFAMIGDYGEGAFNLEKIASFPFDWTKLLQSSQGTTEDTVKRLAFNRSELHEAAFLENNAGVERELVKAQKGHSGVTVGGGDSGQAG